MSVELSTRTSIFGLRLWVVLGICVGAAVVIFLFLISLWFTSRSNKKTSFLSTQNNSTPKLCHVKSRKYVSIRPGSPKPITSSSYLPQVPTRFLSPNRKSCKGSTLRLKRNTELPTLSGSASVDTGAEVSHLGWGHRYTLRELEESTNGFADENVIGEGGYGIV